MLYVTAMHYSDSQFLKVILHLQLNYKILAIFPVFYNVPL